MRRFTYAVVSLSIVLSAALALAHEEGHGPKITDSGKQGGIVSPVVDAKDASKGEKAALVYKSELVRSEDGTVRIYLYDSAMNAIDVTQLSPEAKGILSFKKKKKWTHATFVLKQAEGAYVGKAPKAEAKPFNIDVKIKEGSRELLTAFDNLD